MRLFLFLGVGAEAGFEVQGIGSCEEGSVNWAEVQVVDLADLGPDGVEVAWFVDGYAGLGVGAWLIEAFGWFLRRVTIGLMGQMGEMGFVGRW